MFPNADGIVVLDEIVVIPLDDITDEIEGLEDAEAHGDAEFLDFVGYVL